MRLDGMTNTERQFVIANIIQAKTILKAAHAYKQGIILMADWVYRGRKLDTC